MTTIAIDGLTEDEFRRSIERKLRQGKAAEAVEILRRLLEPYAGEGSILPERFLTVGSGELTFKRWERLEEAIARHDSPGKPITALSIAFGWPGEFVPEPDAQGCLKPHIETAYYTDDAFPFSKSGREDLLEGYSYYGCTWTDDCQASDSALMVDGIDDLHGALALLEARLLASDTPDEDEIRAGSLGACLLSVLLFQAVGDKIGQAGLPRPLCVLSGSNGVYPYFDAPVAGFPEDIRKAAEAAEEELAEGDAGIPGPRYSSLLLTGIPRARKRAVLVLEETKDEEAVRIAKLRGLTVPPAQPDAAPEAPEPRQVDEEIFDSAASPLMSKKPGGHHQSWDFREMLSPREPHPEWDEEDEVPAAPSRIDFGPREPLPHDKDLEPSEGEESWDNAVPIELAEEDAARDPVDPEPELAANAPLETDADWDGESPFELTEEVALAAPGVEAKPATAPGFSLLDLVPDIRPQPYYPLPLVQKADAPLPEPAPAEPVVDPEPVALSPAPAKPLSFAVEETQEEVEAAQQSPTPEVLGPAWPLGIGWLEEIEARILPPLPKSEPAEQPVATPGPWARLRNWWYGRR